MSGNTDILDVLDVDQIQDLLEQMEDIRVGPSISIAKRLPRGEHANQGVRWLVYYRAKEVHFLMGAKEPKYFTSILDALECAFSPGNHEKWEAKDKDGAKC